MNQNYFYIFVVHRMYVLTKITAVDNSINTNHSSSSTATAAAENPHEIIQQYRVLSPQLVLQPPALPSLTIFYELFILEEK